MHQIVWNQIAWNQVNKIYNTINNYLPIYDGI